jgi:hypothetical protein
MEVLAQKFVQEVRIWAQSKPHRRRTSSSWSSNSTINGKSKTTFPSFEHEDFSSKMKNAAEWKTAFPCELGTNPRQKYRMCMQDGRAAQKKIW